VPTPTWRLYRGPPQRTRSRGCSASSHASRQRAVTPGLPGPEVMIEGKITPHFRQGKKLTLGDSGAEMRDLWADVVRQVEDSDRGLCLGTRLRMPWVTSGWLRQTIRESDGVGFQVPPRPISLSTRPARAVVTTSGSPRPSRWRESVSAAAPARLSYELVATPQDCCYPTVQHGSGAHPRDATLRQGGRPRTGPRCPDRALTRHNAGSRGEDAVRKWAVSGSTGVGPGKRVVLYNRGLSPSGGTGVRVR
jgi:hypothetical protein